ncbi:MAG: hypothetical protein RMK91_11005 [Pseudanabaenaceae cyanobacterium SKYGB_i_bin29]|nr:hypothetical protein [Pseudanabaenaceae cyanobacterium SKYGB_i_bin29]
MSIEQDKVMEDVCNLQTVALTIVLPDLYDKVSFPAPTPSAI